MEPKSEYTIDCVAWHTQVDGNPESQVHILARFAALAGFLRDHQLLTRELLPDNRPIEDTFRIHSADLTAEGLTLIKKAYDRWLQRIDRGQSPTDVSLLAKELQKLRVRPQ